MEKSGTVYILASKKNGTLYVGVTSDLPRRVEEHGLITQAISREKTIKGWSRQWKINAIEKNNPQWNDLRWQLV